MTATVDEQARSEDAEETSGIPAAAVVRLPSPPHSPATSTDVSTSVNPPWSQTEKDEGSGSEKVDDTKAEGDLSWPIPHVEENPSLRARVGHGVLGGSEGKSNKSRTKHWPLQTRPKRRRITVRHVPWRHKPATSDVGGHWFNHGCRVSKWMGLFYDLLFVSVLTTFSADMELRESGVIVNYLSYYVVMVMVWKTQLHYDVRYEAEDNFHRVAKAVQIAIFAFIGAAAGGWDLSKLLKMSKLDLMEVPSTTLTAHGLAGSAFLAVGVAFLISRVLLAVQYTWVVYDGIRAGRIVKLPKLAVLANLISAVCMAVAVAIPASSFSRAHAKIAMFYLAVAVEVVSTWVPPLFFKPTFVPEEEISERYAALSLIIIGEGFTGLVGALTKGIKNLHVTEASVYVQAFLVIVTIFNLYLFLFQHFEIEAPEKSARRLACWELVHLPLHFVMLLFMAALVNTIILQNYFNGLSDTVPHWLNVTQALRDNETIADKSYAKAASYLQRLDLQPDFDTMYDSLDTIYHDSSIDILPEVRFLMYSGSILRAIYMSSGLALGKEAGDLYYNLTYMDDSRTSNVSDNNARTVEAMNLVIDLQVEGADDAVKGVLWLFPTAGITVILLAIRSMIRYRFHGVVHYMINFGQVICGVALSLLGLLNIGPESPFKRWEFDVNDKAKPIYRLVDSDWALPIITICYTVVNAASMATAWLADRRARKVEPAAVHVIDAEHAENGDVQDRAL